MARGSRQPDALLLQGGDAETSPRLTPSAVVAASLVLVVTLLLPWFFGGVRASAQLSAAGALAVALVGLILATLGGDRRKLLLPWAMLPILAAIGWAIVQLIPLSPSLAGTLAPHGVELRTALESGDAAAPQTISLAPAENRHDLSLLLLAAAVFFLGANLFYRPRAAAWLCTLLAINGAVLGFFGVVQQLSWNGLLYWSVPLRQQGVPFGPFVNRNNAGGYLNLCLAAALGLLVWLLARSNPTLDDRVESAWPSRTRRRVADFLAQLDAPQMFAMLAIGFIVAGVLCSLSRGAAVALVGAGALTLFALVVSTRRIAPALVIAAAMLAGLGLVAWGGKTAHVESRLGTLLELADLNDYRLPHWRDALHAAPDFARAGSGLGTYRFVYREYERGLTTQWFHHAENQYLEALIVGGVPGLLLILAALAAVAVAVRRLLRSPQIVDQALAVVGLYALSSAAISSFFDFGLYLPANMVLFALLCGAVCGRAAVLAADERAAHGKSAPFPAFSGALLPAALLIGCLFGVWELRGAVTAERAELAAPLPQTLLDDAALAELQAELESLAKTTPDDAAEAQFALARRWIELYQLKSLKALKTQLPAELDDATRFALTRPSHLHAAARKLIQDNQPETLLALSEQPAIQSTLPQAWRHLQLARAACPLMPEVYLQMAQLAPVVAPDQDEAQLVAHALRLAPHDARILYQAGLLDWQAGRTPRAIASWRRSLEHSSQYEEPILAQAATQLPFVQVVHEIMPADPGRLIEIAERHYQPLRTLPQKRLVLAQAARRLEQADDLSEIERRFQQAALLAAQGKKAEAAERYAELLETPGRDAPWRYRYARVLLDLERFDDAWEQASECRRQIPESEGFQNFLQEIAGAKKRQLGRRPTPPAYGTHRAVNVAPVANRAALAPALTTTAPQ